jgi:dihydroneopterin aldolase
MSLFLASVTGPDEADIVLAHGADIIDLVDPSGGGHLAPEVVRTAVVRVANRRPTCATVGDVARDPQRVAAAVRAMADAGVDDVKVGLFPANRAEVIRGVAPLARRTKLIGVMFADEDADNALVPLMAEAGFAGAMLDTARKGSGRLLDHLNLVALRDFLGVCRAHDLMAGLAGSLEAPDVPRLLLLGPDILGFRGALCGAHGRAGPIDPVAVGVIRGLIPLDPRSAAPHGAPPKPNLRLLAARAQPADLARELTGTDRVFVRDFVLPIRVGAYGFERDQLQDVRFDVEVDVQRPSHAAEDMRDVFSYDVVIDSIRMIVARTHIALLETIAERLAAIVLADDRVMRVRIRVEKLNVGPGGVGVEIVRERAAEPARVHQLYPAARRDVD